MSGGELIQPFASSAGRPARVLQVRGVDRAGHLVRDRCACRRALRPIATDDQDRGRDQVASPSSAATVVPPGVARVLVSSPRRRVYERTLVPGGRVNCLHVVPSLVCEADGVTLPGAYHHSVRMSRSVALAMVSVLGVVTASGPAAASATDGSTGTPTIRLATAAPRLPRGATRLGRAAGQPAAHDQRRAPAVARGPARRTAPRPLRPGVTALRTVARYGRVRPRVRPERRPKSTAVTSWLTSKGLADTTTQGMTVRATGDAHAMSPARSASRSPGTASRRAPRATPRPAAPLVPRAVAGGITSIVGLSDTRQVRQRARP